MSSVINLEPFSFLQQANHPLKRAPQTRSESCLKILFRALISCSTSSPSFIDFNDSVRATWLNQIELKRAHVAVRINPGGIYCLVNNVLKRPPKRSSVSVQSSTSRAEKARPRGAMISPGMRNLERRKSNARGPFAGVSWRTTFSQRTTILCRSSTLSRVVSNSFSDQRFYSLLKKIER